MADDHLNPGNPAPDPEEEEEEAAATPEEEDEPEARQAPQLEPDLVALEREQARHYRALVKVFGPDLAGLEPCEPCGTIGFAVPEPVELLANEGYRSCGGCNGYGAVLTGSRREGHEAVDCPTCKGTGYLRRHEVQAEPGAAGNGGTAAETEWRSEAWRGDASIGQG